MVKKDLPKLVVILGPTASGKTDLAIKLAKKFDGEIVSADSRQIYKGMDIGTAKPSKKEIRIIPHYLVGIIKPNQVFNVAIYKKLAIEKIKNIIKKKKLPFLVGGTGLYIKAVVENIEFPRVTDDKKLREKLENKTEKELFKIYKNLDSKGANLIDRKNKRRLIRAIEVCKATKKPFWEQRKKGEPLFNVLQIGIKLQKGELKKRLEKRVEKMIASGLEKEVIALEKKYRSKTPPLKTIGYLEWQDYFKKKITKKELIEKIKLHTLQFTKRQMTWFNKDKKIKWLNGYKTAEKLIKKFLEK
jgi:tRNA dimethylallyltransferase